MQKIYRTNKPIEKEEMTKSLTIRLTETEYKELEKISKILEIPKTRLIRNMAIIGLEDAIILNKLGVLKGAKKLDDFRKALGKERTDAEPKLAL